MDTHNSPVTLIQGKDGEPLFMVNKEENGKETSYPLASRYGPLREAERILEEMQFPKTSKDYPQIIFIFGAGNPSLVRLTLEKYDDVLTVVLENQSQIRQICTEWLQEKYPKIFYSSQKRLIWGGDMSEDELRECFKEHAVKKILTLNNQRQTRIYSEFFSRLKDLIFRIHSERSSNRSTFSRFEKLWLRNITQNTSKIIQSYPLQKCLNRGQGIPAVIVGAGPSLEGSLKILREHQGKIAILACDTVLKILLHQDIYPDLVITIDPQKVNSRYLENISKDDLRKTILVSEPGVTHQGIRDFPFTMMFDSIFPYYNFLINFFQEKGSIDIGGTVITAAYEIAKVFDFSQIAFVGMDFCFQEGTYHLNGSMYEEIFFSSLHRFQTFEMFFSKVINNEVIPTTNHLGEWVYVDRKFLLFKNWLEKKFDEDKKDIYNCSWGGLPLKGLPHIIFSDFIDKQPSHSKKSKVFQQLKEDISLYHSQRKLKHPEFKNSFFLFQKNYQKLVKAITEYQKILKQALGYIRQRKTEKLLDSQDEIVNSPTAKIAKPFAEIVIQKTLYKIAEKEGGNQLEALRHLYQELYDGCSLNLKYLKRVCFDKTKVYSK